MEASETINADLQAQLTASEARVTELLAIGRKYAIHMEYDYPGDVPEECGMFCKACKQHVDDDLASGHKDNCPLGSRAALSNGGDHASD
jgi:hypothetical protein